MAKNKLTIMTRNKIFIIMFIIVVVNISCNKQIMTNYNSVPISVYATKPFVYKCGSYAVFNRNSNDFIMTDITIPPSTLILYNAGIWEIKADSIIATQLVDFFNDFKRKKDFILFPLNESYPDSTWPDPRYKFTSNGDTIFDVRRISPWDSPSYFPSLLVFGKPVIESSPVKSGREKVKKDKCKGCLNRCILTVFIDEKDTLQNRYLLFDHLENNYISVCSNHNGKGTEYLCGRWHTKSDTVVAIPQFSIKIFDENNVVVDSLEFSNNTNADIRYRLKGNYLTEINRSSSDTITPTRFRYVHGERINRKTMDS